MVSMDRRLPALDGVDGAENLIQRIRNGDLAADAELTALYLVRLPVLNVRLQPPVEETGRVADFALRDRRGLEMYVEVTKPDQADA